MLYSAAEGRTTALEKTLVGFQVDRPDILRHIKLEAETRQKLSEVTAQLENYQRVYGDSSIPPDLSLIAKQFKQKDEELQQLRLIKDQQSQVWWTHSCRTRLSRNVRLRLHSTWNWKSYQHHGKHWIDRSRAKCLI